MKQKSLLKTMLLLFALIAGSSSVWAEDVVYKTQQFSSSTFSANSNSYTGSFDNTYNGFTCNYSNFNNNNKAWAYVKCGGKGGAYTGVITTDAAIEKPIKKVTLTIDAITSSNVTSITLYSSDSKSSGWTSVGTFDKSTGAKDVTISSPAANKYYKIEAVCTKHSSTNGLLTISKIQFYIEHVAITSITLPSTESVAKGGTVTLTPTVAPANYTEAIDWESDDTDVATVSSAGVVTGVTAGTAHIKAKAHDNPSTIYGECTVTVTAPVAVTGVSLDKPTLTLSVGGTATLTPTIAPADATNKAVTWESDKPSVATVDDDGKVTAVGEGTCTITVTTDDGDYTATCDVTVSTDIDLTSPISITTWPSLSYGSAATYVAGGVCFTATQCMNNSGLQFKASSGILASPTIKSAKGYTVVVTTNSTGTGTLSLKIGSGTPVSVPSGGSATYKASTTSTSAAFTLTNSSSKACNIASITIIPNSVDVQSYGWATYIAPAAVEFDANTAYVVTDASISGTTGSLTMEAVTQVPKDTPVLLKGAGSKDITVIASAAAPATNLLSIGTGTTPAGKYPYVLAKDGEGACFKLWTGEAATLNGRVVLLLDESIAATSPVFSLDPSGTTAIESIKTKDVNGDFYDLQGRKVAQPTKGLYIVNGKKVIIK